MAKILTARRLQAELGGEIVYFYHDSDHDPRETRTILRHRENGEPAHLNFAVVSKLQRKFSPLYASGSPPTGAPGRCQIATYVDARHRPFRKPRLTDVADFCLEMYRGMGLLDGIDVVRSSDPEVRAAVRRGRLLRGCPVGGRTRAGPARDGELYLHEGGDAYVSLPAAVPSARSKPARPATRDYGGCSR